MGALDETIANVVAEGDESARQIGDVRLHAAGNIERIGADQTDPHRIRPGDKSASHNGCTMCQSCGCWLMPLAKKSASS